MTQVVDKGEWSEWRLKKGEIIAGIYGLVFKDGGFKSLGFILARIE
jgi:hypothetical protein